jgi:hypothetical protein
LPYTESSAPLLVRWQTRHQVSLPPSGGPTQVGTAPNLAFSALIRGQDTELKIALGLPPKTVAYT